jgi:nucleoid-associated protein YgaU
MLDDAGEIAATRYIAKHTVAAEETLSHIALKHYGHATKPYYTLIYDANKKAIGDDPNRVKPGLVLNIPELPDELKVG